MGIKSASACPTSDVALLLLVAVAQGLLLLLGPNCGGSLAIASSLMLMIYSTYFPFGGGVGSGVE